MPDLADDAGLLDDMDPKHQLKELDAEVADILPALLLLVNSSAGVMRVYSFQILPQVSCKETAISIKASVALQDVEQTEQLAGIHGASHANSNPAAGHEQVQLMTFVSLAPVRTRSVYAYQNMVQCISYAYLACA